MKNNKALMAGLISLGIFAVATFGFIKLYPQTINQIIPTASAFDLNQTVTAGNDFILDFNQEMDQKSVEQNLILPENLNAKTSWDNSSTLRIVPGNKTQIGQIYKIYLDAGTKYADGKFVGQDLNYRFNIADAPVVSATTPARDAKNVNKESQITITFDRPVAPLSAVQGDSSVYKPKNWNLSIEPQTEGSWRWLGTSTVQFEPKDLLTLGTKYTVNIPAGLEVLNGDKTEKDFSFSFETVRLEVKSDNSELGPDSKITLNFNQKVNLEEIRKNATLKEENTENKFGFSKAEYKVTEYEDKDGEKKSETDETTVLLAPAQKLKFNTSYDFTFSGKTLGAEGDLPMGEDYTENYKTVGEMKVTDSHYDHSLSVDFSNKINQDTLKDKIIFSPELNNFDPEKDIDFYYRGFGIWGHFEPSTTYEMTIKSGVEDVFGQKMAQDYLYTFTTPALEPQLTLHNKDNGQIAVMEASAPQVMYINTLNTKDVKVELAQMNLDQYLKIKQENTWNIRNVNFAELSDYHVWDLKNNAKENEWKIFDFDIEKELGQKLNQGIYIIRLTSPQMPQDYYGYEKDKIPYEDNYIFTVTDTAGVLKYTGDTMTVWATSMEDGTAKANAHINIYNLDGKIIGSGLTDTDGIFTGKITDKTTDNYNPEMFVEISTTEDKTYISSQWNAGMQPWSFGYYSDYWSANNGDYKVRGFLTTDRPTYRPGDTVYIKGIYRLMNRDGQYEIAKDKKAQIKIQDANYDEIYNTTADLNEFGNFDIEFPISADSPSLGDYEIGVTLIPDNNLDGSYNWTSFQVLEYKKPEYKVELTPEKENYLDGDEIKTKIEGSYYFGAPLVDAPVSYSVMSQDYFYNKYEGDIWYSFALEDSWCWYDCSRSTEFINDGTTKLDASGIGEINIKADISEKAVPQVYTIEGLVSDPNNQQVAGSTSVVVHKADTYVGIAPTTYVATPNVETGVDLITLDVDGNPVPNQAISVEISSRTWNTVKKKGIDGEFYNENEPVDTVIQTLTAKSGTDGKTVAKFTLSDSGQYRIVAKVKDSHGNENAASTSIYVYGSTYTSYVQPNSNQIELITDKKEYNVGDTAKILIKSPYSGENIKLLTTVEREQIMQKNITTLNSNSTPIEIKITEDMLPNIFVSAVILKPREGQTFNEFGKDTGAPDIKIGYANLQINTTPKKLSLEVKTDKEKYLPAQEVVMDFDLKDSAGHPAKGEIMVSVVDSSLIALTGYHLPNLMDIFYNERGIGIQTAQNISYLFEYFKTGTKGGGGADFAAEAGNGLVRKNFQDTAYFNGTIITDADGKAQVKFNLPDNLTTWKITAIANTADSKFGAKSEEFITTKNVIVRDVIPRFALVGDEIEAGAITHNYTDQDMNFDISLAGSGFEYLGNQKVTKHIKSGESEKVNFKIKITDLGKIKFNFKAESGDHVDEIIKEIPSYVYGINQTVATMGQADATEQIFTPSAEDIKSGDVNISAMPTLAVYLDSGFDWIFDYSYGCSEQIASQLLANIAYKNLIDLNLMEAGKTDIEKNITTGLQTIYNTQNSDGGFGYYSTSRYSSLDLTAYMVYTFAQLQKAGYKVNEQILKNAVIYLEDELKKEDISDAERVYILYTLSLVGTPDQNQVLKIFQNFTELPVFAKAQLGMTLLNIDKEKMAYPIWEDLQSYAQVDARGASFQEIFANKYRSLMQDTDRTTAEVLQFAVAIAPEWDLLPRTARYISSSKQSGHWSTTTSTALSIFALRDYMLMTGETDPDYLGTITLGGQGIFNGKITKDNLKTINQITTPLSELPRNQLIPVEFKKDGTGEMYYDMIMNYFLTAENIAGTSQGFTLTQEILPVSDSNPDKLEVGQNYKIKLNISVPTDRQAVAIDAMLPAGFEALDAKLKTNSSHLQEEINNEDEHAYEMGFYDPYPYHYSPFDHIEYQDDKVFLFADRLPAGNYTYEYLVRATTPGDFLVRPSKVWEMYTPENFATTEGYRMNILE